VFAATCWAWADAAPLTSAATAQEIKYFVFMNNPPKISGNGSPPACAKMQTGMSHILIKTCGRLGVSDDASMMKRLQSSEYAHARTVTACRVARTTRSGSFKLL
jgi:hypothetical protein